MKNGIVLFVWIVFTTVIAFTTVACSKSNKNVSMSETEISSEETSTTLLLESSERESETESLASETISQKEETKTKTSTETTTSNSIEETIVPETPAPTKAKEENISHKQTQATEPKTKTQKVTEESKKQKETKASKPSQEKETKATEAPTEYWATQKDAPAIAKKVIEYINQYRVKEGKWKLTQGSKEMQAFADLRSKQIRYKFSHDQDDTNAAVKKLKYGEFWQDGWFQAFSNSTEAIHHMMTSGSVEFVAKTIVDELHSSKGHWAYLGNMDHWSGKFYYITVGLYYEKCEWYCSIWVDEENHTGPVYID